MSRWRKLFLMLLPALAGSALLASTAASAAVARNIPMGDAHAQTVLTGRPDSGGNGNWAVDTFDRKSSVTFQHTAPAADCGLVSGPCYSFTAALSDSGIFTSLRGEFAPNQGAPFTGEKITGDLTGSLRGYGDFTTFYANAMPSARNVPHVVSGSNDPSYLWPQLYFPHWATVTGLNEATWDYSYTGKVFHRYVAGHGIHRHVITVVTTQHWNDGWNNDGGQLPADGQITG
jgi:hypothetical protein